MSTPPNQRKTLSRRRRRLFRLASVLIGFAFVGLLEAVLWLAGVGGTNDSAASLVEFSEVHPLFVANESARRFEIPPSRQFFFQPESFSIEKSADEFRVFCFGGSTVQGRPYSIETSFTTWLELALKAAQPDRSWEVVNCGGVSYASYRLVPIVRESLQYSPDLWIVYTGHNEFLEERSYGEVKRQPQWVRSVIDRVATSRIYGVARSFCQEPQIGEKISLPAEVDALLDYQGGLSKYHRNDSLREAVIDEFRRNIRQMISIANQNNIPILFINPVSNLRDTPPFKVEPPAGMNTEQRVELQRSWQEAKDASWNDLGAKLAKVESVLRIDDRHCEANFLLAKVYEALGEYKHAKEAYLLAKDEDVCPLRMLEPMHEVLKNVTSDTDTELIDIRAFFEARSEFGIPGDNELIDHVHPRIEGHQMIADEIFKSLVRRGTVQTTAGWEVRKRDLFRENFESLPENYFPESVARLRGLELWTQGRVTRLKLVEHSASE
ncbi:MAG: hypothetical protein KDB00_24875 [Planctomycetales bacterium]|nr:hypothetical protein [Planctomycetales bacterium]